MSKKSLNTSGISNELAGASLFFTSPKQKKEDHFSSRMPVQAPVLPEKAADKPYPPKTRTEPTSDLPGQSTGEAINSGGNNPDKPAIAQASTQSNQDAENIERIRKVVKTSGKEVTFVRLLPEEKEKLVDIVYVYRRLGIKTSENEIGRIAINFLTQDYEANGENSVLAKVLAALNA